MQLEGMVIRKLDLEQGVSKTNGNPWSKATLIVEVGSGTQFPKKVALINMSKAQEFYNLEIGKTYTFKIDVESREYNGKWYSDIRCYAWQEAGAPQPTPQMPQPQQQYPPQYAPPTPQANHYAQPQPPQQQGDDLPF